MKVISIVNSQPVERKCILLLLFGSLFLFASCIVEKWTDTDDSGGVQDIGVTIRMKINAGGSATRALTEEQESRVDNVYVFFFDAVTDKVHSVVEGKNVTNVDDVTKTFNASLLVAGNGTEEFKCIVIANIESWMQGKNLKLYEGLSYGELQWELVSNELTTPPHTADGGISMWGVAPTLVSASRHPQNILVPMIRALARVDIGVGQNSGNVWNGKDNKGKDIPFVLEKVYIYKPGNAYSFMPKTGAYDPDNARVVTAPSPVGTPMDTPFEYNVPQAGYIRQEVYIPEANVVMDGTGLPGDANHLKRCAIVVGGKYAGHTTSYYRIDFNDNATPRHLTNVLRNHCYRVSIASVGGDGEATPDDAYRSINVTLNAEIVQWADQSQDIIFDGVDWVYIEKKSLMLPGAADVRGYLSMGSSVESADWEMSFDGGVTWTKDAKLANADFEVTKPTVADGGSLTLRTLNTLAEGNIRSAKLNIRIKRLKFEINIRQVPDVPDNWLDGGEIDKEF